MKKILFITISSGVAASTRVRVDNLIPELEKCEFSATTIRFPKTTRDKWLALKLCSQSDMVFLQKRTPPLFYAKLIRFFSKKLIYDFDDAIYFKPNEPNDSRDLHRMKRFENIIRKADLVIAGNEILANEARNYTYSCRILPSAVENRNIPVKNYDITNPKFIIGWVGGEINLPCLEQLSTVLQQLAKRHEIQLRVISSKTVDIPGIETLFIPWNEKTQEIEIAQFDVGIMPLNDYPHTRGKCAYKALQYMAAGVPPIVSDVGVNSQVVKHGECGFVVQELSDFGIFIEKLIMDRSLIRQMGEAAKDKIDKQFSVEYIGKKLAELLK